MKAKAGTVGIDLRQGKLRMRLPRSVTSETQRFITTRLDDTPENRRRVQRVCWDAEEEIKNGVFDVERYKSLFVPTVPFVGVTPTRTVDILELWSSYLVFIKPQLEPSTFKAQYQSQYSNHIKALPSHKLTEAVAIRDYLLASLSPYTSKRVLCRLSACCEWAKRSKLIPVNPFVELLADVKVKHNREEPDPFSRQERDAIVEVFKTHKVHSHYAPFIEFLFLTGCRTGEAIGLRWCNVTSSHILFTESFSGVTKQSKATKTGKSRRFPINEQLEACLASLGRCEPESLVFTSSNGNPIHNRNFTVRVWKGAREGSKNYSGVLLPLVEQGLVERYRPLYNTRHTFCTLALEAGLTLSQVARLVGNSPQTLLHHYSGAKVDSVPFL